MPVMIDIELLTDKQIVDEYKRRMALRRAGKCTRCGLEKTEKTYAPRRCVCQKQIGMFDGGSYGTPGYHGY